MKNRGVLLLVVFLYFVLIFLVQKVFFMLVNYSVDSLSLTDMFAVLYHGLPMEFSMSGYLTVIPALFLIASIWIKPSIITKVFTGYFLFISLVIALIAIPDMFVYPYWGFHIDSTVFLYLQKPKDTFASASIVEMIVGFWAVLLFSLLIFLGYKYLIKRWIPELKIPKKIARSFTALLLLTALLFLPIRGGITVSTMNAGKVYFSDRIFLNHAAINPQFNLMYSLSKSQNFASQYQFFDKDKAANLFSELNSCTPHESDTIARLLKTQRPNVILFILESFSAEVALDSLIAPNMTRLAKEGVLFENFYANSFRTDRGLVSVLSGYPSHPTVAIMKYPQKTESLPTIPKAMRRAGYANQSFYYGGDADFANMRSYFVGACGISNITSDKDFPLSQKITKWGAPDAFLLDRVYSDLTQAKRQEPFLDVVLTLSSHEPFDVPTKKFGEPFLNAVNYTDSCIGKFVERLQKTVYWDNTLLVFVADHAMQSYPAGVDNNDARRFHIPLIWAGGAVKGHEVIQAYSSQNDLAATLLSQLNISHQQFRFSKDIMNPSCNKFAFYSYVNGFSMIDSTGVVIYDNDKQNVLKASGNISLEEKAKAFFQTMYLDLGSR